MAHESHPHKVLISAEMKKADIIEQQIILQGCNGFLEEALLNIFLTIYEKHPDLFLKVMDLFMEKNPKGEC